MKNHPLRVSLQTFTCLVTLLFIAVTGFAQTPSIEGTYKLTSRKLPDGTIVSPPDVMGLMTYTKTQRNLNVFWKGPDGKPGSYSLVSTYKLTPTDYTETLQYNAFNDPTVGPGPAYDTSHPTKSVPVTLEGKHIQFKLPFDQPSLEFDGDKLTATAEGAFVDYWEKVR